MAEHLNAHQITMRSTDLLTFNLLGDVFHLVYVELTGGHHHVGELGVIFHSLQVGDIALGGHVDLHADLSSVLDHALVRGNDGRNAVGLDGIKQLMHLFHLFVVDHRVDGDITLHAVGVACLGELIYFFEMACAVSGYMLDVNPFDQPGVEAYKKNMFALLGKKGFEEQTAELNKRLNL